MTWLLYAFRSFFGIRMVYTWVGLYVGLEAPTAWGAHVTGPSVRAPWFRSPAHEIPLLWRLVGRWVETKSSKKCDGSKEFKTYDITIWLKEEPCIHQRLWGDLLFDNLIQHHFQWENLLHMAFFNSYVQFPEGNHNHIPFDLVKDHAT